MTRFLMAYILLFIVGAYSQANESVLDNDKESFKGQSRSLIDWKNLKSDDWLDFHQWRATRELRDQDLDWKIKLRDLSHKENVGKVIKCIGLCYSHRGASKIKLSYRSDIILGDEIELKEDSYAWVYLADGALLRISPMTSVSFNEILFSNDFSFKYIRLNYGHVHLRPLLDFEFTKSDQYETELQFLPLMEKKANREFYLRENFKHASEEEKRLMDLKRVPGVNSQVKTLNAYAKHELFKKLVSRTFLSTPVATIDSTNKFLDVLYEPTKEAKFRVKNSWDDRTVNKELSKKAFVSLRGYNDFKSQEIEDEIFYSVSSDGRDITQDQNFIKSFKRIDYLQKRNTTVELLRQLWVRKYSSFLFEKTIDIKTMATMYGRKLWQNENALKRINFLDAFIRRTDTSLLYSMEKMSNDHYKNFSIDEYSRFSFIKQLRLMKTMGSKEILEIKNLNDIEFQFWINKKNVKYEAYSS